MPIEAWEAKTGKKLEEGLYKGTLRCGGHAPGCGCSAGGEIPIQPITGTKGPQIVDSFRVPSSSA